jgi:hypothetical protein
MGCKWRGDRIDQFQKHLQSQKCGLKPAEEQEYQIYDGKMVLYLIKYSQDTEPEFLLTAQNFAVDLVRKRALELGKQEWLDDPWGRSDKQARRDRRFESRR